MIHTNDEMTRKRQDDSEGSHTVLSEFHHASILFSREVSPRNWHPIMMWYMGNLIVFGGNSSSEPVSYQLGTSATRGRKLPGSVLAGS